MRVVKKIVLSIIVTFCFQVAYPVTKGSDTVVTIEPYFTFPAADSDNEILTFGFFKNGFGLQDATTSCTFKSIFPLSGNLNLHGGSLYLDNDLQLKNNATLVSMGHIYGDRNVFDLSENVTGWANPYPSHVYDLNTSLHSDLMLSGTLNVHGDCLIDGGWNCLILGDDANVIIRPDSSLHLRNIEIDGIRDSKMRCLDDSGRLILDNVRWVQESDYSFSRGSILYSNEVNFVGPYEFKYDSLLTSTIDLDSRLYLSDIVKVTIGRKQSCYDRNPLYFEGITSEWRLENCTVNITASGLQVTNGTVTIDGEVKFDMAGTNSTCGLIFGDGNGAHDPRLRMCPSSAFNLLNGYFVTDTVDSDNVLTGDVNKKFIRQDASSHLYVKQDLYLSNLELKTSLPTYTSIASGKKIVFDECIFQDELAEFNFTGTRLDSGAYVLSGNGEVILLKGALSMPLTIQDGNNYIRGSGNVDNSVILCDSNSVLNVKLNGGFTKDIQLNGGKLIVESNLNLYQHAGLGGPGVVDLGECTLKLNPRDGIWTSTVSWLGAGATIDFDSNVSLAAEQVMTGDYTLAGNQNTLNLSAASGLIVDRNSKLTLKNMTITGFGGNKIRCRDNSGTIEFANVHCVFDDNFTVTIGSLLFSGNVDFTGSYSFIYESALTSTINVNSTLNISDNMSLVIGRKNSWYDREPLYFVDKSSGVLFDEGNLFINRNGMRLTHATFSILGSFLLDMDSTGSMSGLIFGDGTSAGDITCNWGSGSIINFRRGDLTYELVSMLNSRFVESRLQLTPNCSLWLNRDTTLSYIGVEFSSFDWHFNIQQGKTASYNNISFNHPGAHYHITGKRYSSGIVLLDGNGEILSELGDVPLWALIMGTNNSIHGAGGMDGSIILGGPGTELRVGLVGQMCGDITLNGGKVILDSPLFFGAADKMLQGDGTVDMNDQYVYFESNDLNITSTVYWDCIDGYIMPESTAWLSSTWTVSGNCTLMGTGKNSFIFNRTGKIIVERGSTLYIRDIMLKGLRENQIYCMGPSARVVLDRAKWHQDEDFNFENGSLIINNTVTMDGVESTFAYKSDQPCIITSRADLTLGQDFIFSYEPSTADRSLVVFEDNTSRLLLDGATLASSSTGMQLTRGMLKVNNNCYLQSQAANSAEGIMFGDGSASGDLDVDIMPSASLDLTSGYLRYCNVN